MTLTLTRPVAAGDLLTGLFAEWDATGQVAGLRQPEWNLDTRGSSTHYSSGKGDIALYYRASSSGSTTGLVITISASGNTYLYSSAAEYSGHSDKLASGPGGYRIRVRYRGRLRRHGLGPRW